MKNNITQELNKDGKLIRRVRSFVCHHRKLTVNQKNALQILWPKIGLDFTKKPILLSSIFGNTLPVILEIGFGTGASLIAETILNPTKNFLGIEVYIPGISSCLIAANNAQLSNLRLICHDAVEVLESMLPDNSLSMVQLFFPDPWPKVKHNKRRIISTYFAELILHKLKIGGIFYVVTDCNSYAKHILNVMYKISNYKNLSVVGDYVDRPITRPITKFEKRSQQLGYDIFDIMFKKIN